MRLGGWLRLWVVLVVLYGLVVAAFTVIVVRKEQDLWASKAWKALDYLADDVTNRTGQRVSGWQLKQSEVFKKKGDREIAQSISDDARRIDPADPKNKGRLQFREQILALDRDHSSISRLCRKIT